LEAISTKRCSRSEAVSGGDGEEDEERGVWGEWDVLSLPCEDIVDVKRVVSQLSAGVWKMLEEVGRRNE
jgi:hypothetical protein